MTKLTLVPAAALLVLLGACSVPPGSDGTTPAARNATTPGWTGRTLVLGNNSSVAGDAQATYNEQKWQLNRGR